MPPQDTLLNEGIEILIAEDILTQAERLKYLLEERGYTVTVAADGEQALAAARRQKPALIISEILMPKMNGYQLCREIRFDDELKDIPFILVTALSDPQDVVKSLECGVDSFVSKPYDEEYLLSRIEYLRANHTVRQRAEGGSSAQTGLEIYLGGHRHFVTSDRQQILDLLISTYDEAIRLKEGLNRSNQSLNALYRIAEGA